MMKYRTTIVTLALLLILIGAFTRPAWAGDGCRGRCQAYGGYCQGPRWGWYGARTPVTTVEDARKHLEKFFEKRNISIGAITDGGLFFKAEIKDHENTVVNFVIINKRTGRIRSLH